MQVDGDEQRPVGGKRPQHVEEAERDRPRLRRAAAGTARSSATSSRPLRRGEPRERAFADVLEQVGQPGERELRLGAARARGEDAQASASRRLDRSLPERRLPDPRLAFEDEDGRAIGARRREPLDRPELGGPCDHIPSIARRPLLS